eukprot:TRINITY_DN9546_c0_g1_i2.p1 TRINITY_DN9546_c0_g1~~TRINITY_DN9546_c0_g1_i2.p1  ORF type:complete len:114 (+),score=19.63 TRINITY_DN9546_c0_g1_i2:189-530(+)
MGAIFEAIYSVSEEAKHPNVLLFENLRRLYDLTSTLKIDAIKEWRRKAQVKYREHLQAYVESILGRPMAQLSVSMWCFAVCFAQYSLRVSYAWCNMFARRSEQEFMAAWSQCL